jgi:hypothetical protein
MIHANNRPQKLRQVGPLFCYGQNILDKGQIRLRDRLFYIKNRDNSFTYISNQAFYALSDDWTSWIDFPVKLKNNGFGNTKRLIATRLETEYAYHHRVTPEKRVLVTVFGNCIIPTEYTDDDNNLNPYNGTGSVSFYLATTASLLTYDWYAYGSAGIQLNVPYHKNRFGQLFRYEWIVGHSLPTSSWNTYIMLEFSGVHLQKNRICGIKDVNSGGDVIYLGPSFVTRSDHFYVWTGIQGAVLSNLNGNQQQATLRATLMMAVLF